MAEYIDRDRAIETVKFYDGDPDGIPWAIRSLKDIPAADVRPVRWIPVTERLPESVRKSYLCLTDTGYHCEVRWTNNVYGLGESDKWGWSIVDVPQYCKVTHWMPLPEPPKENDHD